jgi:hypothetical protein
MLRSLATESVTHVWNGSKHSNCRLTGGRNKKLKFEVKSLHVLHGKVCSCDRIFRMTCLHTQVSLNGNSERVFKAKCKCNSSIKPFACLSKQPEWREKHRNVWPITQTYALGTMETVLFCVLMNKPGQSHCKWQSINKRCTCMLLLLQTDEFHVTLFEELHNLYSSPSIIRMAKSRGWNWQGM